ncbi:unnamed protein product [Thelazia callipaeda]|uniref:Ovule protein n=1 Tax=Thelazia callipaeda TaxID=103827 RepID=A0A0N5CZH4_THECL|nr:unnamed protein product [Thelazia callipaeda]
MQEVHGREINRTNWKQKIISKKVDSLILGTLNQAMVNMLNMLHKICASQCLILQGSSRYIQNNEAHLIEWEGTGPRNLQKHDMSDSKRCCKRRCKRASTVEPGPLQRALERAIYCVRFLDPTKSATNTKVCADKPVLLEGAQEYKYLGLVEDRIVGP